MKIFTSLSLCFIVLFNSSFAQSTTESFRTNLYLLNADSTTKLADGCLAEYNNLYSAGVDYMDANKITNFNESLSLSRDGVLLSIERRPIIISNDTLFFNLIKTTQRSYQFQFIATALNLQGLSGFFIDSYTNTVTPLNLSGSTSVNFVINADAASQNPNRFQVIFQDVQGGSLPLTYTSIKALQQNNSISVNWDVQNEINVKQYEVEKSTDGVTFNKVGAVSANASGQYNWVDMDLVNGEDYYRISSISSDGDIQYSSIVKVSVGSDKQGIAVFTNPVNNGVIKLQFTNMPKGTYNVKLVTSFGQLITKQSINYTGGSSIESVLFNRNIAKGAYELEIIKPGSASRSTYNIEY